MNIDIFVQAVSGRIIVSCQAAHGHPLRDPGMIARMAQAAELGGAAAIRCGGAGGIADVQAVAAAIDLPIIGLTKTGDRGVFITPTADAAVALVSVGADVVAADATNRSREIARSFGAASVVDSDREDAVTAVMELTHGHGAALVVDATGRDSGRFSALRCVAPGGVVGLYGLPERAGRHGGHPRQVDPIAMCRPPFAPVALVYQVLHAAELRDHLCGLVIEDRGAPGCTRGIRKVQELCEERGSQVRDLAPDVIAAEVVVGAQRPALPEPASVPPQSPRTGPQAAFS